MTLRLLDFVPGLEVRDPALEMLADRIGQGQFAELGNAALGVLKGCLRKELTALLAIDPLAVLGEQWLKGREVMKVARAQRPGEIALVEHTLELKHEAELHVKIDGMGAWPAIPLCVTCKIEFEGVILNVQAGQLRAVALGKVQSKASFKMGPLELLEHEFGELSLPGVVALVPPLKLAEPPHATPPPPPVPPAALARSHRN
jgi:hypothetical protein